MNDIIKVEKLPICHFLGNFDNLSTEEITKLIIEIDIKAFYFKGKALQYVKENNCYKDMGYKTFESYVKDVLGFSRRHAYRLLNSTIIYDKFCDLKDTFLPTSETHIRPLIELSTEQQVEVWKEVAKDKVPTAKEVQEVVNIKYPKSDTKKAKEKVVIKDTPDYRNNIIAYNAELKVTIEQQAKRIKELEEIVTMQSPYVDRYLELELLGIVPKNLTPQDPQTTPPQEDNMLLEEILLTRTEMHNTIETFGKGFQPLVLKGDKNSNEKYYNIVCKIKEEQLANRNKYPITLSERILNSTGYEPDKEIGTVTSLPHKHQV